ncbi:MAG: G5 domain-containing protein [Actinomycetota bacterium]
MHRGDESMIPTTPEPRQRTVPWWPIAVAVAVAVVLAIGVSAVLGGTAENEETAADGVDEPSADPSTADTSADAGATTGTSEPTSTVDDAPKATVTLRVGDETWLLATAAPSVGELLRSEGITLNEMDTLVPSADTPVSEAMTITVTRIRTATEVRTEAVAHGTVEQDDPDRSEGSRAVVTEGVDGERDVTYALTYVNDQVTSQEVVSSSVTKEPVDEVIAVGTNAPTTTSTTARPTTTTTTATTAAPTTDPNPDPDPGDGASAESAALNWEALAHCEATGNPRAVNPSGPFYGLYQFRIETWRSVGGTGLPIDASPEEQTYRARLLFDREGIQPWTNCGPRLYD